jgi:hypothetical protein
MAYLKVLSRHLSGGTEEIYEDFTPNNRSPGRDLNPKAFRIITNANRWATTFGTVMLAMLKGIMAVFLRRN